MRKRLTLFLIGLLPFLVIGQGKCDAILGTWLTEVKDAEIEIYRKSGKYFGRVVWIKDSKDENGQPVKDAKNPDKARKNKNILGMDIITNLIFDDSEWKGGSIYDPKNGETYTCKLWLENGNLKVRGYLGWFYDTKTWTKAN